MRAQDTDNRPLRYLLTLLCILLIFGSVIKLSLAFISHPVLFIKLNYVRELNNPNVFICETVLFSSIYFTHMKVCTHLYCRGACRNYD